jgi:hypothetical protein
LTLREHDKEFGLNFKIQTKKERERRRGKEEVSLEDFRPENRPVEDRHNYVWRISTIIFGTPDLSDEEVKELIRRSGINPDNIMNPPMTSDFSTFRKNLLQKRKLCDAELGTKH